MKRTIELKSPLLSRKDNKTIAKKKKEGVKKTFQTITFMSDEDKKLEVHASNRKEHPQIVASAKFNLNLNSSNKQATTK